MPITSMGYSLCGATLVCMLTCVGSSADTCRKLANYLVGS
jgi:hypothetical protein